MTQKSLTHSIKKIPKRLCALVVAGLVLITSFSPALTSPTHAGGAPSNYTDFAHVTEILHEYNRRLDTTCPTHDVQCEKDAFAEWIQTDGAPARIAQNLNYSPFVITYFNLDTNVIRYFYNDRSYNIPKRDFNRATPEIGTTIFKTIWTYRLRPEEEAIRFNTPISSTVTPQKEVKIVSSHEGSPDTSFLEDLAILINADDGFKRSYGGVNGNCNQHGYQPGMACALYYNTMGTVDYYPVVPDDDGPKSDEQTPQSNTGDQAEGSQTPVKPKPFIKPSPNLTIPQVTTPESTQNPPAGTAGLTNPSNPNDTDPASSSGSNSRPSSDNSHSQSGSGGSGDSNNSGNSNNSGGTHSANSDSSDGLDNQAGSASAGLGRTAALPLAPNTGIVSSASTNSAQPSQTTLLLNFTAALAIFNLLALLGSIFYRKKSQKTVDNCGKVR